MSSTSGGPCAGGNNQSCVLRAASCVLEARTQDAGPRTHHPGLREGGLPKASTSRYKGLPRNRLAQSAIATSSGAITNPDCVDGTGGDGGLLGRGGLRARRSTSADALHCFRSVCDGTDFHFGEPWLEWARTRHPLYRCGHSCAWPGGGDARACVTCEPFLRSPSRPLDGSPDSRRFMRAGARQSRWHGRAQLRSFPVSFRRRCFTSAPSMSAVAAHCAVPWRSAGSCA